MRMRHIAFGGLVLMVLGLTACGGGGGGSGGSSSNTQTIGYTTTENQTTFAEDGSGSISVVLNKAPNGNVAITVTSTDSSEALINDTVPSSSKNLVFTASNWNQAQTVTINGVNDAQADGNQTFDIKLSLDTANTTDTTGYAGLASQAVNVTVQDIDAVGYTVSNAATTFAEDGSGSISVVLNKAPDGDVVITVTSTDSTEALINDTVPASSKNLVFTASNWDQAQTVTINGVNDAQADGNQTFDIKLSLDTANTTDTTGYAQIAIQAVGVTVQDIDKPGVTISNQNTTFAENASGSFDVVLNTIPDGDVAITVTSSDITEALVSKDGANTTAATITLVFNASNWSQVQTVTLAGQTDAGAKDGNQTISINVELDATNTTDTTGYAAFAATQLSSVSAQVLDSNSIMVSSSNLKTSLKEGGALGSFDLVLNTAPDGDVVVKVTTLDGTEVKVSTGTPTTQADIVNVTFNANNWQTPQTINLHPQIDGIVDGNKQVLALISIVPSLTTDTTGYASLTLPTWYGVDVKVAEVDAASFSAHLSTTVLRENTADVATLTVSLNTKPNGNVVLDVTPASADLDVSLDGINKAAKQTLTFTPEDWSTAQKVAIYPVYDPAITGDKRVSVRVSANSTTADTTGYKALNVTPPAITIVDYVQ